MAHIVVLKGGSLYSTLRVFSDDIAQGFRNLGHRATVIDLLEPEFGRELAAALQSGVDVAFGINGYGCDLKTPQGVLWDAFEIPFVVALVDHPLFHMDRLTAVSRCLIACVDPTHADFVHTYFKDTRPSVFLPLAGCRRQTPSLRLRDRSIPVFFSGSYVSPDEVRKQWLGHGVISRIMDEIAEAVLADVDLSLLDATTQILLPRGIDPDHPAFDQLLRNSVFPDRWVRARRRREIIQGLVASGIEVHCYGAGWEQAGIESDRLRLKGLVEFEDGLRLMADAQVVLNVLPNFPAAPHDRCFSAMLNGAVAASDTNRYLAGEFSSPDQMLLFDWRQPETLAGQLAGLFADPDRWDEVADRGRCLAEAQHTWRHRAQQALGHVQEWIGRDM